MTDTALPTQPSATPPAVTPARGTDPTLASTLSDLTSGSSGVLMLLVLVFVCYAWATQGTYVWDDDAYVSANTALRSFGGLSRIWTEPGVTPQYYPMTFTSFWLETQLVGLKPAVSHVINLLLHAGSVLLLWKVLQRLAMPGAWVAAAVFAVHPIGAESVAWISERKNTLSMLFGMSSVWIYLRYARLGVAPVVKPAGEGFRVPLPDDPARLYRLFLALFTLALLSKTTMAVLPGLLLVVVWWKRGRITRADVLPLLPAFALGLAGGLVTSWLEHSPYYVGATGDDWNVSAVQRVMLVGQTSTFYAWKTLWPFPVGYSFAAHKFVWPFPASFNYYRWTIDPKSPLQWLPLAGLVGVVGGLFAFRHRIGRGPLACALVFLGGLLPACGLFTFFPERFSWVADHFAYVGSVGLIVGVVAGLTRLIGNRLPVAAGVAGVLLAACCGLTVWETLQFKDLRSLWERTIQQNPRSWMACINYGVWCTGEANRAFVAHTELGDDSAVSERDEFRRRAELWMREGLRIKPDVPEGYASLGKLARERGDLPTAIADFRKAMDVARDTHATGYQAADFMLGETLAQAGRSDEAAKVFDRLDAQAAQYATRNPNLYARMYTERGNLIRRGLKGPVGTDMSAEDRDTLDKAYEQYLRATEVAPDFIPAKMQLAYILFDRDVIDSCLTQLNDVLRVDKTNVEAKMLFARVAIKQQQYDVAVVQLDNVLQLDARYLPAHLELAKTLRTMGHLPEAIHELQVTLQILPDATPARQLLAEMQGAASQPSATQRSTTQPASRPAA